MELGLYRGSDQDCRIRPTTLNAQGDDYFLDFNRLAEVAISGMVLIYKMVALNTLRMWEGKSYYELPSNLSAMITHRLNTERACHHRSPWKIIMINILRFFYLFSLF